MPSQKWINLRRLFKFTSPIIDLLEKPFLYIYGQKQSKYPTIYIVGAPRTGSTLLYQLITDYLDVLYIDNLTDLARNNLFFGISLSQFLFRNKKHKSTSSEHGRTEKAGLHAPNEGLFWYRWLPTDRHFTTRKDLTAKSKKNIVRYHNALKNKYHKPLVIKNLSFGMRINLIQEMEPNAKIIHVIRNPYYTIQSIYLARKKIKWPLNKLWSIKPKNEKEIEKLPIFEQIFQQINSINAQIESDAVFFGNSYLQLKYEDLCMNPRNIMIELKKYIECEGKLNDEEIPVQLNVSNKINLNESELQQLKKILQ